MTRDIVLRDRIDAVVIGASAGAVEALNELLPPLSAGLKPPIVVAVHLLRDRRSLLAEIFAKRCALAVAEAQDKESIENRSIYFAPPDYHLLIEEGRRFALSVDDLVNFSRPSIDVLFESASEVYKERLMGIILTGANVDGAQGLEAIARCGGVTVVQDPATASSPTMVEAALQRVKADFVLPLGEIARLLNSLASVELTSASFS